MRAGGGCAEGLGSAARGRAAPQASRHGHAVAVRRHRYEIKSGKPPRSIKILHVLNVKAGSRRTTHLPPPHVSMNNSWQQAAAAAAASGSMGKMLGNYPLLPGNFPTLTLPGNYPEAAGGDPDSDREADGADVGLVFAVCGFLIIPAFYHMNE
ncbi:hypothetical protein T492DRAFT_835543 [Pavlovales sp. CCMP2436]|nr:hypothetical protein T492DRAFT_835543 [Pavlovales sp. CCMP2436]